MKVVIAGGTGFIGQALVKHFRSRNDETVILTRNPAKEQYGEKSVYWDGESLGDWTSEIEGTDVLINLSGKSVDCRYNLENKREILASRVNSTTILGRAVASAAAPPGVWINSSTATIYRHAEDRGMDEFTGEIGDDFSMNVAKQWEETFFSCSTPKTRKVAARTSLVLGAEGGVYPVLRRLAKWRLAGRMGDGKQLFSWIHIDDLIAIFEMIIVNENLEGSINCTSENPVSNGEFMKELRASLNIGFGLPAPKWLLRIGTFLVRTEPELVLKSRWVIPQKLIDENFEFKFKNVTAALSDLT